MEMARQGYAVVVHGSTESARLRSTYEEVKTVEPRVDLRGGRACPTVRRSARCST